MPQKGFIFFPEPKFIRFTIVFKVKIGFLSFIDPFLNAIVSIKLVIKVNSKTFI